jgi:hypothetical protein
MKHAWLLSLLLLAWCGPAASQEQIRLVSSSSEFLNSFEKSISDLERRKFGDALESASLNAITDPNARALLHMIRQETRIEGVALGDAGVEYDVILQPGHYLRTTGAIGTSGKSVSERALVAYVVAGIARDLRQRSLKVLVISADNFLRRKPGLQTKMFLAVHADGNERPCTTGPSMGYEKNTSMYAMHAIGWGLSQALGYTYSDFMRDNLTVNEAHYYMFSQVRTTTAKGILEIGELTCEKQEEQLIVNADVIAANLARALRFVLNAP